MAPHAINNLTIPVISETASVEDIEKDGWANDKLDAVNNEVESLCGIPFFLMY
jgi:hypothetical protein